jgi:hypothetical protein
MLFCAAAFAVQFAGADRAQGQLRIVTYNISSNSIGSPYTPRAGTDIILKSIGEEQKSGIAKPIDVLLVQEQNRLAGMPDTQAIVNLLNTTYAGQGVTYARGNVIGSGDTTQGIIYRTQTVDLMGELAFGTTTGTNPQPRQTLRYQLKPHGYDDSATFYAYDSHYKASDIADDPNNPLKRNTEAIAIRANSDALGDGIHAIYAGDHNFYSSTQATEPAVQTLIAAGPGQANDPLNRIGVWHNSSTFKDIDTQSPTTVAHYGGQVTGGMDDRFDFQWVTGEMLDNEGLSYISGSYHAFGNNGTTFNSDIDNASNTYTFSGASSYTKAQILGALATVSDHLPVVADYQVPAIMQAVADSIPATLGLGQVFNLGVTVSNAANVVAANGADELDYSLTTSGNVTGSFLNQTDMALGGTNTHMIGFDTSTAGMKSGLITITSPSQQVQNGLITIPISYQVLSALTGDYNGNGIVDAADYTVWRDTFGQSVTNGTGADGSGNGTVDQADYDAWVMHFGESSPGSGAFASAAVPEPGTAVLLILAGCFFGRFGRRHSVRN